MKLLESFRSSLLMNANKLTDAI